MMKYLLIIFLIPFFVSQAFAFENGNVPLTSLFFSPEETYEASMLAKHALPEKKGDVHLGAILYYGPDDWTLWLQSQKWTPETSREGIRVLEVTANEVRLSLRKETGATEIEITLKPNQSYEFSSGKIIGPP